ncbi:MAG: energy-coupling factor transporter ATPase [Ruminococcaceae bacterium]|nr:energy-coupling factor transporter ATPase [Oscillospiraceae bacterium]
MKTPFIKCENLSFSYTNDDRSVEVLRDIDLQIDKGSFVAILGHNGSGKSTLAKLFNLILTPASGRLWIDGIEVTSEQFTEEDVLAIRRKIGMVFQNPDNQLVATVVEEDIAFGPENLGVEPGEIRKRVDEALETVGMTAFKKHSPHQLSGGQKQRIAIAGVIAMLPDCIVFDESTAMLDPIGRDDVMRTIRKLNEEKGITVIHITHNMNEAVLADRVVVIDDGVIALDGTPRQVFTQVEKLRSVGLDVPQVTELFYELKNDGLPLPNGVLDECEGADAFEALLKGGR